MSENESTAEVTVIPEGDAGEIAQDILKTVSGRSGQVDILFTPTKPKQGYDPMYSEGATCFSTNIPIDDLITELKKHTGPWLGHVMVGSKEIATFIVSSLDREGLRTLKRIRNQF